MTEEVLVGGVANAGRVVRVGDEVLRPAGPYSESIHRFLGALREVGFPGVPAPVAAEPDGRERLSFIAGDVAVPPYPEWVQRDEALVSLAVLTRRFHEASYRVGLLDLDWSPEMADPEGGPLICHNDICLENVVFHGTEAVGLLDLDFAAPGSPIRDLAALARMCVPVDDPQSAANLGWSMADRAARTRLLADSYGLSRPQRQELLKYLDRSIGTGGQWVLSKVKAGDPNFIEMWNKIGGMDRFDRRRGWWNDHRGAFVTALD
ncbi:MAG: phosphotransferase [Acidimicrobiales bacterium]